MKFQLMMKIHLMVRINSKDDLVAWSINRGMNIRRHSTQQQYCSMCFSVYKCYTEWLSIQQQYCSMCSSVYKWYTERLSIQQQYCSMMCSSVYKCYTEWLSIQQLYCSMMCCQFISVTLKSVLINCRHNIIQNITSSCLKMMINKLFMTSYIRPFVSW